MAFPAPTQKQGRILWVALTALAIGILLGLIGLLLWGAGWVIQKLSPVLLPLAIAGIIAYLLDPVVDYFERRKIPRAQAISLVFFLALLVLAAVFGTVVPRLIGETERLVRRLPVYAERVQQKINELIKNPPLGIEVREFLPFLNKVDLGPDATTTNEVIMEGEQLTDPAIVEAESPEPDLRVQAEAEPRAPPARSEFGSTVLTGLARAMPAMWVWAKEQFSKMASWFGLIIGMALVPVYTFYLLWEKQGIQTNWTDYLPVQESRAKEEIVFVLKSINYYLILFFRGQVLVALCDGVLLTIGFLIIGLDFAFLLGMVAGLLSIVPFLGVVLSIVPTTVLAAVQFGDWLHPILVIVIFSLVQLAEGLVISPKIMGDRVGLHPLTIIIAVMVGTTLMGGILGGILAIPLTAALRVLMFRYVWQSRPGPTSVQGLSS